MKTSQDPISLIIDLLFDLKTDHAEHKEITIKNTSVLEEHERRSTASEKRIETLEAAQQKISHQAAMVNGFLKISAGILGIVASIAGIIRMLKGL